MLTYEELETVLCEIEGSINARPLVYQSADDLGQAISPFHVIYGQNVLNNKGEPVNVTSDTIDDCLRYVQKSISDQWKRFYKTYLNELRQHHIYGTRSLKKADLSTNDVVVIKDDVPVPRSQWRLGRVTKLIKGQDGQVRGAELAVVTPNQERSVFVRRPVQKLIPLEIEQTIFTDQADIVDTNIETRTRPIRKAVLKGETLRRIRNKYV